MEQQNREYVRYPGNEKQRPRDDKTEKKKTRGAAKDGAENRVWAEKKRQKKKGKKGGVSRVCGKVGGGCFRYLSLSGGGGEGSGDRRGMQKCDRLGNEHHGGPAKKKKKKGGEKTVGKGKG